MYRNSSPSGCTSPPCGPGPSMLGIAPIVYPSIRRGGPGGAEVMAIVPSRAMLATCPSNRAGDAYEVLVMFHSVPDIPSPLHRAVRFHTSVPTVLGVLIRKECLDSRSSLSA